MCEQFGRVYPFVVLGPVERNLVGDVLQGTDTVRAFATDTDTGAPAGLLAEESGPLLGLEPGVEVTAVVEAAVFDR